MDNTNIPSYTPSFDCYFELNKSICNLEGDVYPTRIRNIYVYLKLRLDDEMNITMHPHISFGGKHELTCEEWKTMFVEKAGFIRSFFQNPSNSTLLLPAIACNRLHVYAAPEYSMQNMLILLSDYEEPLVINCLEWINIERVMEYINSKIKYLKKTMITYENRMNFFKKYLKIRQPKNPHEARQIINSVCKEEDMIDCEIKCYVLDFLYNISVL